MPLAAVTYRVRPGHEEQLTEVFSPHNFQRVDSPVVRHADGSDAGMLLGTGLFVQDDVMVRVIHHDGVDPDLIGRHMSVQDGVHAAEEAIAPYLAEQRDTSTPDGFLAHFRRSLMAVVEQHSPDDRPAAGTVALRLPLRPGAGAQLLAAAGSEPSLRTSDRHPGVVRTALFLHRDTLVRAVQYDGHPYEVVGFLSDRCFHEGAEEWLAPYLAPGPRPADPDAYLAAVHERAMLSVSHLSVLGVG
jgi:hypothetical protein